MDGNELIALERLGWEALSSGEPGAYYREHLARDAVMAFAFGVMEREDAIAAMDDAPPWSTFDLRAPRIVGLTEHGGTVVYTVDAQRNGDPPHRAVCSSTYVRRDGESKLAFHQQTPSA